MSAAPTLATPLDAVLDKLEGVKGGGNQYEARCPAHVDSSPSLAVSIGADDRVLLHCHAGCELDAVLDAIEMKPGDLFTTPKATGSTERRLVATYPYTDEAGDLLFEVVRFDPKDFRQRRPDGRGGWLWKLDDTRRVLYRLPEVVAAVAAGDVVWVVEGEKDADALVRAGEVATCNPQGAGKWSKVQDAAEVLAGATVIVWADDDKAGHDHARKVVADIDRTVHAWIVVRSTYAKDAAEHLGQGRGVVLGEDLKELAASDGDQTWLTGPQDEPETPEPAVELEETYGDKRGVPGGDAILDQPEETPAVWGEGAEVLWAEGEPAMIAAPPGVGKTTLGQQVVLGLIGLRDEVLGYPVNGDGKRVLYLAMDRPRQITRSFRRMVTEADRVTLNNRLVIRPGPPPADLASDVTILVQLARTYDTDIIVIDSLKDAAVKLTDDETAGRINRAIQTAIAEGIEVLILHHQRKGQGGEKPKKLEDVYGNTWITAGLGSVILLWGAAGDPIVELMHLKQPADEVGPFKIAHDHHAGTTEVFHGFDLLRYLGLNPAGVTSRQVAAAMFEKPQPSETDMRKARRKLDAAVARGIATRTEAGVGGEGGSTPARYYPAGGLG